MSVFIEGANPQHIVPEPRVRESRQERNRRAGGMERTEEREREQHCPFATKNVRQSPYMVQLATPVL